MASHDDIRDRIIGHKCSRRTHKILAHAAAHRKLYDEIDSIRQDRDRYQRMISCLSGQMVTQITTEGVPNEPTDSSKHRWKIMVVDGDFYEFDGLTRQEAEIVWCEAWGLDLR